MHISSKCYYGLRAVYDLAVHFDRPTVKIAEVAARQHIPPRFLEMILAQLKQGGFVESRRGADGGYRLAKQPSAITVGDVIRFIDGPIAPVDCVSQSRPKPCTFDRECSFFSFWKRAREALAGVLDGTSLADLVEENKKREAQVPADWTI
jgi:Rrf2 family protein